MLDRTRTICIVDQNEEVVAALQLLLGDLGAGFAVFQDAESYLDEVESGMPVPVCLIVELRLPGRSGLELFEWLRARGIDPPTVVIASDARVSRAVQAIRAGVLDYFEKPFIEPRLHGVVSALVDGRRECGDV